MCLYQLGIINSFNFFLFVLLFYFYCKFNRNNNYSIYITLIIYDKIIYYNYEK